MSAEGRTSSREWESGIGGAQCSSCLRTTVVRAFDDPDDPLDDLRVLICRPCWDDIDVTEPARSLSSPESTSGSYQPPTEETK